MGTQQKIIKCNEEDRISSLPDTLIHHILSFVDMRYAVETSVLSTRWRNVWCSLPTLNFDSATFSNPSPIPPGSSTTSPSDYSRFIEFVNQVFVLRYNCDIRRFCLRFYSFGGDGNRALLSRRIYSWIVAAVRCNVQEIYLPVLPQSQFRVPHCLFTCKTLVKLDFYIHSFQHHPFELPNSISLPSLQTLHITGVCFVDETLSSELFSRCPILESLTIVWCKVDLLKNLIISTPKLKHLDIDRLGDENIADGCQIKIYAPNLISFKFRDQRSKRYHLNRFSALEIADIQPMLMESSQDYIAEKKEFNEHALELLSTVRNVKSLKLSTPLLELVSEPPTVLESFQSQFLNLSYLKLVTWLSRDCIDGIMHLLKISPNLETLIVNIAEVRPATFPYYDKNKFDLGNVGEYQVDGPSSQFMLHDLKVVEVRNVQGGVNELKFLESLLRSALVLEKIVLYRSTTKFLEREKKTFIKFSEKLLTFPRASSNIALFFF